MDAERMLARCTPAILAGGRGARLGGADKGLLPLAGRPLLAWVLAALDVPAARTLIVANRHHEIYATFGATVIGDAAISAVVIDDAASSDEQPGFHGPLAGMLAALRAATTPWVLCVPCDAPGLPRGLAARLLQAARRARAPAAYAWADGQEHPVCCVLSRRLAKPLAAALAAGERAPRRWLAAIGAVPGDCSTAAPSACWSINTPAQLAAAERRYAATIAEARDGLR